MLACSELDSMFVSRRILKLGAIRSIGKRKNVHGKLDMVIAALFAARIDISRSEQDGATHSSGTLFGSLLLGIAVE